LSVITQGYANKVMLTITVKNKTLHHDLIAVQAITVLTMRLPSEKDTAI